MTANIANVTNLPAVQPAAVAIRQPNQTVRSSSILANPEQAKINMRAAELFASSDLVPSHYRNKTANCFIAINRAQRLGVDELYFFEKTYIVKGKLGLAAELAIELANSSGRFRGPIQFRLFGEGEARACTAFATLASDGAVVENTVTYAMAVAEGWSANSKWQTMRDQMLQYRAGAFLVRLYAGGALGGMYMREELEDVAATKSVPKGDQPGQTITVIAPPADEPESPITEDYITEYETGLRSMLERVKTLDALDDLWRTEKVEINAIGGTDDEARLRLISAFSQTKADILDRMKTDAEAGQTPEPAQSNDAAQNAEPARQAPSTPEDAIATATKAMQADEPAQTKHHVPFPVAINVMRDETGKVNWKAFFNTAKAQITAAVDNEYPTAWMVEWEQVYRGNLTDADTNETVLTKIEQMRSQARQYLSQLDVEAATEAAKFPTVGVEYDGENPNWTKFADALKAYVADTTSHRVARIWWAKHAMPMQNMREANPQAAEAVEQALYGKFPQLAK